MCGILGSINRKIDKGLLNQIKHRGPDRQAIYEDKRDKHEVYLAHTRLSIVDLSEAGNQPMISEDNNYVLIFNGEIYNHLELRKNLSFKHFRGHSDTETLLYYLIECGTGGLKYLNGIFSFVFYNRIKNTLLLVRDPFGVKPLYYSLSDDQLVFSSEVRPIRQIVDSSLDSTSLGVLLNLRYVPSPYTLYKGIYKMRPGHYGLIDLNADILSMNFSPYLSSSNIFRNISFRDAVDEYEKRFESAVKRQLMADVDLGILLSGGIDSALVGGIASKNIQGKLRAFTVGFDSKYSVNEAGFAADTARYFNMEHHIVKMNANTFFDEFSECCRIVEEPLATTSFIPMYYLSKLASEHVKVVLTGQGADEPLGGYGRYQGELLRDQYPAVLFKIASAIINLSGTKKEKLLRGARSLAISDDVERFMNVYSLFTPEEVKKMTGRDCKETLQLISYYYNLLNCASLKNSAERMMALDLRMNLADDLLLYTDKITMNFSLECRVPMLDLKLVDFLESLPISYKVSRNHTKIIHKEYARKVLPEEFINRPKLGFQSPTDIWFREKSADVESLLLNNPLLLNYVEKSEIKKIIGQHQKGYNREKQLFLLLSLGEWLKNN